MPLACASDASKSLLAFQADPKCLTLLALQATNYAIQQAQEAYDQEPFDGRTGPGKPMVELVAGSRQYYQARTAWVLQPAPDLRAAPTRRGSGQHVGRPFPGHPERALPSHGLIAGGGQVGCSQRGNSSKLLVFGAAVQASIIRESKTEVRLLFPGGCCRHALSVRCGAQSVAASCGCCTAGVPRNAPRRNAAPCFPGPCSDQEDGGAH